MASMYGFPISLPIGALVVFVLVGRVCSYSYAFGSAWRRVGIDGLTKQNLLADQCFTEVVPCRRFLSARARTLQYRTWLSA